MAVLYFEGIVQGMYTEIYRWDYSQRTALATYLHYLLQ